jgi:hypothetical protein
MSYAWQLRTGKTSQWRASNPIYCPFYYGQNGAAEVNGALPANAGAVIDYSDGMGRDLNEASLNETQGIYNNIAVHWNADADTTDTNVSKDLNEDGDSNDVVRDFPNWFRLVFSGPRQNGEYGN